MNELLSENWKSPKWDLTISIVSYFSREDIENFLDGFYSNCNSSLRWHVFIVNNGTDSITDLEQKYHDLSILQMEQNLGFGAGHNSILDRIDSRYHAIVNPDIIYAHDAFFGLIQYLDSDESVGMVAPLIKNEHGQLQKVYRRQLTIIDLLVRYCFPAAFKKRFNKHTMQDVVEDASEPFACEFVQGSFLLVRSSLFKQLGGFDERFFIYVEDADLCKRVNAISKVMVYPKSYVIHKWKKESHWNRKLFFLHFKSLVIYFQKWGWKIL